MKRRNSLFRNTSLLVAGFIFLLGCLFISITYFSTVHYYQATTQRLNKDVAAHIAKFTSPFEPGGLNRKIADSIFYDAMVISPSVEVYFLDTAGTVMYYHAPDSAIKLWKLPLDRIKRYIDSKGLEYIKAPDPKFFAKNKIFSAAEVINRGKRQGYIYVILGGNDYQTVSELLFGNHITRLTLQGISAVIILSILISLLYLSRIKKNLKKIMKALEAYRSGDYSARFDAEKYNEFTSVAESFNQMADLLTYNIHQLQQSEKERKDFLANISHDLRTPLTVIRGYLETLQEETLNEHPDRQMQINITALLYKKLEQLELMIIQLFELSKMESIGFKLSREPFNLAELIEEMVTGSQSFARRKNIRLTSSVSQEMAWVHADIALMERCIQNLVDNAIRHTSDQGEVNVQLQKRPDNMYLLIIDNTGMPLSPNLLKWINNHDLNQEQTTHGRKGLGLAIIKKIIQLHEYRLQAMNTEAGVRFTLSVTGYPNPASGH